MRLTLLHGCLFLIAGAMLLAITYVLVARLGWISVPEPSVPGIGPLSLQVPVPQLSAELGRQRDADMRELLIASGIALGFMTVVSVGLGWVVARRALHPLRTMADTAQDISERNLHRRLEVRGPRDEIKRLADTFDGLLGRIEGAFEAQRRFVANASHELRTPLTVARSLLEVTLADPDASAADLRATCRRVLANNQSQEQLIEALLTLARSQRGLDHWAPLDLAVVVDDTLDAARDSERARQCRIEAELRPAQMEGDLPLLERLAGNLVDNAIRYNVSGGWVRVWTGITTGRPTLRVANSGLVVATDEVAALFQPFQRLNTVRMNNSQDGLGVGLSIVDAIVTAHGAELHACPFPDGGLDIEVSFRPTLGEFSNAGW
ncbi:MAG TPA: HAMP domain-containing sensor histidine kinase [Pseudonocardiaceae bacterium]|nr:HAMP domain-containing sensor histidine kinase [Pseudonocardiaceae bacterium]